MKFWHRNSTIVKRFKKYRFELGHLTVILFSLVLFQLVISFVHKNSIQKFLLKTQQWYQQESAERLANLTTTSLELLLESKGRNQRMSSADIRKIVQDFNIIFSQQILHKNVQEICILVRRDTSLIAIDDGQVLYEHVFLNIATPASPASQAAHTHAVELYRSLEKELSGMEHMQTVFEGKQTFHIFVPFVPRGEYIGAVYMKNTPDFAFFSKEMIMNFDETTVTYSALILVGLLAMFYVSSVTLRERDKAQQLFFQEQKEHLAEQITHQKETLFTKRIYHTHHKAEKVMGFIKEDLREINAANVRESAYRIGKYANFVARVIYDMKWYEPPLGTIRSPLFDTDINELLKFLVDNIFTRVASQDGSNHFALQLDPALPHVAVNEFVIWEVFEPIIQNSFDHGGRDDLLVTITTSFDAAARTGTVSIADNGCGISAELLERDAAGMQKLFQEHVTTKQFSETERSGYGCYIAHEIATQRCGWKLSAENLSGGGCVFHFIIPMMKEATPLG